MVGIGQYVAKNRLSAFDPVSDVRSCAYKREQAVGCGSAEVAIVVRGKTGCSVCGQIISGTDEIVMFPHFIWDEAHPLWRFSDSAMHQQCFTDWDKAEQFRAIYNKRWPEIMPTHPREMLANGLIVDQS